MTADGRQPHVLIVDDTRELLDLMRELLEEEGYRVSTSMAVLDPAKIRELAPNVIVQDLRFEHPPQGGGGFLSLMQLDPALARIPLILCTAAGRTIQQPEIERQLDHLGVRVVLKPFDIDELLTALADVLGARAPIAQAAAAEASER